MNNSQSFVSFYNKIEEKLEKMTEFYEKESFPSKVKKASESSPIIRRYKNDLLKLSELRNVIVHEFKEDTVLAEPSDIALNLIQNIYQELTKPKNILDIAQRNPFIADINDTLSNIVKIMNEKKYSQVPIYESKKFIGLITENGITRWLGRYIVEDVFSLSETKIGEVLECEENTNNYKFFSKKRTFYDAQELFEKNIESPIKIVQAILITENGKQSEMLLGIVTAWNISKEVISINRKFSNNKY